QHVRREVQLRYVTLEIHQCATFLQTLGVKSFEQRREELRSSEVSRKGLLLQAIQQAASRLDIRRVLPNSRKRLHDRPVRLKLRLEDVVTFKRPRIHEPQELKEIFAAGLDRRCRQQDHRVGLRERASHCVLQR